MAFAAAMSAAAAPSEYQKFSYDEKAYVPFDAVTTVTVECPDSAATRWLASHLKEWYGDFAPKVATGATGLSAEGNEGYAANVDASGVKIKANTIAGVRWASYTLRQLAIAKRGTLKTEGMILPTLSITDAPLYDRQVNSNFGEVKP